MSAIAGLSERHSEPRFLVTVRAGDTWYRWSEIDLIIDTAATLSRSRWPGCEPIAPRYCFDVNINSIYAGRQDLLSSDQRGAFQGRLIEVSPIRIALSNAEDEPGTFPKGQEISIEVADPADADGEYALRGVNWANALVVVSLYVPEPRDLTVAEEVSIRGGAVWLFSGRVFKSAWDEDRLTLRASDAFGFAFEGYRNVVMVDRSKFPEAEEQVIGTQLPIVYGLVSAADGRRRYGGAVKLVPLSADAADVSVRNTLWGVASHPITSLSGVWIDDGNAGRKLVSESAYTLEEVVDPTYGGKGPGETGAYTLLRFDPDTVLPDEQGTALADWSGDIYADVAGKPDAATGRALQNPMDIVMDFIDTHTTATDYLRAFDILPNEPSRTYESSFNTPAGIYDIFLSGDLQGAGVADGEASTTEVIQQMCRSFGLNMFLTFGRTTGSDASDPIGACLEFSHLDTPTSKRWEYSIDIGNAEIQPFTRDLDGFQTGVLAWVSSDIVDMSEIRYRFEDVDQSSAIRARYAYDYTGEVEGGYAGEIVRRLDEAPGNVDCVERFGETVTEIEMRWVRQTRTASQIVQRYLWRYGVPRQVIEVRAPLRDACRDPGYTCLLYVGRQALGSRPLLCQLLSIEVDSGRYVTLTLLVVDDLWRPGTYVTCAENTYEQIRAILGDEDALPEFWSSATGSERRYCYLFDEDTDAGKRLGVDG